MACHGNHTAVGIMTVGITAVGIMTVGIMAVGITTVGIMAVGILAVGIMTPPRNDQYEVIYSQVGLYSLNN
jgi:hypothetical protein